MNLHMDERVARRVELAIRLGALASGALGGPCFAIVAFISGRPILALGSVAAAGPLAVARLIPPPGRLPPRVTSPSQRGKR